MNRTSRVSAIPEPKSGSYRIILIFAAIDGFRRQESWADEPFCETKNETIDEELWRPDVEDERTRQRDDLGEGNELLILDNLRGPRKNYRAVRSEASLLSESCEMSWVRSFY
jgi:hypothetical protein